MRLLLPYTETNKRTNERTNETVMENMLLVLLLLMVLLLFGARLPASVCARSLSGRIFYVFPLYTQKSIFFPPIQSVVQKILQLRTYFLLRMHILFFVLIFFFIHSIFTVLHSLSLCVYPVCLCSILSMCTWCVCVCFRLSLECALLYVCMRVYVHIRHGCMCVCVC